MKGQIFLIVIISILLNIYPGLAQENELPQRLVLAADSIPYELMKKLQNGMQYKDEDGNLNTYRLFSNYFPAGRNISTFPSKSDVAWADILKLIPPPGYQRYFYTINRNVTIGEEGVSDIISATDYERSMHWFLKGALNHLEGYLFPVRTFHYELDSIIEEFWQTRGVSTFYAFMLSTDDIQHMAGDIVPLLVRLDKELAKLEQDYLEITGKKLEILIISDHGNSGKETGKRVKIFELLNAQNYNITHSLQDEYDVVIPTSGMLNSIEVYVHKRQIKTLVKVFVQLEGVDLITNTEPNNPDVVNVTSSTGEMAKVIRKNENYYSYKPIKGDPLDYLKVVSKLKQTKKLTLDGFAHFSDWLIYTRDHYYPAALERIYRGHNEVVLNPAPIILSLKRGYEHVDKWTKKASEIMTTAGTHGALDKVSSVGMIISNFKETPDVTTHRVAKLFDGFRDLRNFRSNTEGKRFITPHMLSLNPRNTYFLTRGNGVNNDMVFLHLWSNKFTQVKTEEQQKIHLKMSLQKKDPGFFYDSWEQILYDLYVTEDKNSNSFLIPINKNEYYLSVEDIFGNILKRSSEYNVDIQIWSYNYEEFVPFISVTIYTDNNRKIWVY